MTLPPLDSPPFLFLSDGPWDPLQPSLSHDFDFLTHLSWDHAAASTFDLLDPASTALAAATGADVLSSFSSPDLGFAPCLDSFATPLFDFFPPASSLPVPPPLSSATTSLSNTPATANFESPSPAPPSPDSGALLPGLKLPQTKASSKPGRRPAAASLSHTTDGRITKRSHAAAAPSSAAAAVAAAALDGSGDDVDAEIIDRRHRNNLAAKRYRQKKIDRIEELENEVKEVKQERDDLRIRLARQEAEVAALREMLKMKNGNDRSKD
ncbi:hypothetical protein C8A01DRAFT_45332 [Parachaetomium inaequale]|uniref:BZIP domain-containing protein n=1 Tax=Parachaetomium inaequale TaxID=2588326 RepID=A0AAN6PK69_9PEZI|nr:hypothetical protein C8A01DRAFT_45332 [Parachaetomium inaequale]